MQSKVQPKKVGSSRTAKKTTAAKESTGKKPAPKATTAIKVAKTKPAKKASALNAAYQVLKAAGAPMTTKEMIDAMTAQGLWTSPGGKTPDRTLYSAILREINTKEGKARFAKTERGKFAVAGK